MQTNVHFAVYFLAQLYVVRFRCQHTGAVSFSCKHGLMSMYLGRIGLRKTTPEMLKGNLQENLIQGSKTDWSQIDTTKYKNLMTERANNQ